MPSDEEEDESKKELIFRHVDIFSKDLHGDEAKRIISREDSEKQKSQRLTFYVNGITPDNAKITISMGNTKLGLLPNFNLPARSFIWNGQRVVTCPGASLLCRYVCYAQKGPYVQWDILPIEYAANYAASLRDDFVSSMIDAIKKAEDDNDKQWIKHYNRCPEVKLFRLHASGDFYSAEYARKWLRIAEKLPYVHFYVYTKAWIQFKDEADVADIEMTVAEVNELNAKIMDVLRGINELPNFQVLLSTDRTTGPVPDELLDEGFKEAGIDFAYAESKGRKVASCLYQKTLKTALMNPKNEGKSTEQLIKERQVWTCDRCGFCWDKTQYKDLNVFFKEH